MENSLLPRWKAFLAATLAMIVLVGCGARIDTVLTVEKDESGTREMHLTLSESDFEEYVEGSVDDLEAVIKENLPEQLEVSDITTDDGDLKATFTLEFDSPEDYLEKVSALVDDTELQADISVPDTLFVQGVVVEESFTSDELLEWLVIALEDEGLVDSDAASDALDNSGDKELKFGDETEAAHEPFQVSNVQDRGLALVEMETSLLEPGSFSRIIRYSMSSEVYEEDPEEFDAFFESIVPEGGDLEQSSGDPITWTVEFAADDADGLAAKTATALDSDAVEFSVEQDSSGAQVHTTIVNMADCVNMCSEDAPTMTDTLRVPAHWEFDGYAEPDQDHQVVMEEVSATPLEFSASVQLHAVEVTTKLWPDSTIETIVDVSLDGGAVTEELTESLTPEEAVGRLDVSESDELTTLTLTLDRVSYEEFNENTAAFLPGAHIETTERPGTFFREEQSVYLHANLAELLGNAPVAEGVTHRIEPQGALSLAEEGAEETSAESLDELSDQSFELSSVKLSAWITLGVIAAFIVALALVLVVFRKQISQAYASWSQKKQAQREAQDAHRNAGTGPYTAASPQQSVPGEGQTPADASAPSDPGAPREWSEADLI
ncbi:MAG TPA: hypothetical protein VK098_05825 [Beutenbergiaceae bacterium]|nr:hypothetical protein [Beutenbergiaceae bacterium]